MKKTKRKTKTRKRKKAMTMNNLSFIAIKEANSSNIERRYAKCFGYNIDENGIAKVYAEGSLNDEGGFWTLFNDNYTYLKSVIEKLVANDSVRGIVFVINSPGGYVDGCFEACQFIRDASKVKPIWSYGEGMVCSAAYALASSCTKFYIAPSCEIGSVGVQARYMDVSEHYKQMGIITKIFRSKNAENKNLSPDSEEGKKQIQDHLDYCEGLFYDAISQGRGLSKDDILEGFGHGLTFMGQEAVDRKMCDGICFYEELIENFTSSLGESEGEEMDITKLSLEEKKNLYEALLQNDPSLSAEREEEILSAERKRISALIDLRTEINAEVIDSAIGDGRSAESIGLELYKLQLASKPVSARENAMESIVACAKASQAVNVPSVANLNDIETQKGLDAIETIKKVRGGENGNNHS